MSQIHIPQATSELSVWLDYLVNIHSSSIDLGLERVQKVASEAGLLKPAPTVITVAGTNGKGSTCALMEAILIEAGYRVGVYSSPHLIRYNERVRINGSELNDESHISAFSFIEQQRGDTSLSFFEYGTLAALRLFLVENVEIVLLEVGLGGRLDATNVVDHDVSVITSLAIDHVDWLGDDINVIGYEKAGIFRPHRPAICGQPCAPSTVAAHADDIGSELYQVGIQYDYQQTSSSSWQWSHGSFCLENLPLPNLPVQNAATALMALAKANLNISDVDIVSGLNKAKLSGRMQQVSTDPVVLLDVAHNPHSADYLASSLHDKYQGKTIHTVVAMLHDKDIAQTLAALTPSSHYWYPASLYVERAATAQQLAQYLPSDTELYDTPVEAFEAALTNANADDVILVVGSFHTVGAILEYWQEKREINGE